MADATLLRQQRNAALDNVYRRSLQLKALLMQTYAEAGDQFRDQDDETQDNYMWACGDTARELVGYVDKFMELDCAITAAERQRND